MSLHARAQAGADSFYEVNTAAHALPPEIILGSSSDMKAGVVGISKCRFHSARQMVFFSVCSHLNLSVMSISLVS